MPATVVDSGPKKVSRTIEVHASSTELFDIVADPFRHSELDGSGTVVDTVSGPHRLAKDVKFSVKMKQHGVPYRITSRVTEFDDGRLVEWRHPMGHRWRWELTPKSEGVTQVTETFDYSHVGAAKAKSLELFGMKKQNAEGIERTLNKLEEHYSQPK
jgi:hypothetical protein